MFGKGFSEHKLYSHWLTLCIDEAITGCVLYLVPHTMDRSLGNMGQVFN